MSQLTPSTREAARGIGITDTALRKAEGNGRIAREPDGQWDIDKTRRRVVETVDPAQSPLPAGGGDTEATPFARPKVAHLALTVESKRGIDRRMRVPPPFPGGKARSSSNALGSGLGASAPSRGGSPRTARHKSLVEAPHGCSTSVA